MRILFVSLPDLKKIYPQRPHQIIKRIAKKHEVTVLSVNAWWLQKRDDTYLTECLKNVDIVYMSNKKINAFFQELSIIDNTKLFKKLEICTYDVLVSLNDLIATHILLKRIKIPLVFDICDDIPKYIRSSSQVPYLLKPIAEYISTFIMKRNIRLSKKVTYTVKSLKRMYCIPLEKSVLIPNGVDTQLFHYYNNTKYIKDELNIAEDDFILGFVGFLGEWIDVDLILIALKKLLEKNYNIKMIIVGEGSKLRYAINLAKRLKISNNVIFTGSIPYLQVPKYISLMDICLLPFNKSKVSENAFPLKLLEYLACERVVISTPLSNIKETIGDKVIYVSNSEELVQKVIELYHNDNIVRELGKKGRKFIEKSYSWDKLGSKFEKTLVEASES